MNFNHAAFSDAIEIKSADGSDADENAIVTKALDDFTKAVEAKMAAAEKKSADRLDKLEAKLNRPAIHTGANTGDAEIEKKALATFYRTGSDLELKTLTTTTGTTGIVSPTQLSTTILEKIAERSPIRQLAGAPINMTGPMVSLPRLVNEVEVSMVAETTPNPRPNSEPSFEQINLMSFEMSTFVPISRTMLEDANVDLTSYIQIHLVRRFAQKEARQFVLGNATTEAEGVLISAEVGTYTTPGNLGSDDLIELFYAIKSDYSARGAWVMNRKTMASVRKLKDESGSYIWQSSFAAGQPNTILGRPVYEAVDMPDIAPGATPIVFGDFEAGYQIVDRIAFEPLRVDVANVPVIQIGGRRRVGGRVVMGEALAKLKLKAA